MPKIKSGSTLFRTCAAFAMVAALASETRAETTQPASAQTVQAGPIANDSAKNGLAIRRIIIESGGDGSKILQDSLLPLYIGKTGVGGAVLWSTQVSPRIGVGAGEAAKPNLSFPPPAGETRFILFEVGPGAVVPMHATPTIDQFVLIEGEIELYTERGPPVTLHPGDTVILLGAKHKWVNNTNKPAKGILTSIGVAEQL